tara:strand:+ start:297 stop:623 length:327 start_codon:yes stop_codon:yes gene_type:complete
LDVLLANALIAIGNKQYRVLLIEEKKVRILNLVSKRATEEIVEIQYPRVSRMIAGVKKRRGNKRYEKYCGVFLVLEILYEGITLVEDSHIKSILPNNRLYKDSKSRSR